MIETRFNARLLTFTVMFVAIGVARADEAAGTKPIDIGSRLELLLDDYLIERLAVDKWVLYTWHDREKDQVQLHLYDGELRKFVRSISIPEHH